MSETTTLSFVTQRIYLGIVQIFMVYNVKWIFMMSLNVRSIQSSQMVMSEGAIRFKSLQRKRSKRSAPQFQFLFRFIILPIIFAPIDFILGKNRKSNNPTN